MKIKINNRKKMIKVCAWHGSAGSPNAVQGYRHLSASLAAQCSFGLAPPRFLQHLHVEDSESALHRLCMKFCLSKVGACALPLQIDALSRWKRKRLRFLCVSTEMIHSDHGL